MGKVCQFLTDLFALRVPGYYCFAIVLMGPSYNRTSMARTSLGPWKFVRDSGSSSHGGLLLVPYQEAKWRYLWDIFLVF